MKKVYLVHDKQESPIERKNLLEMAGYDVRLMEGSRDLMAALKDEEPNAVVMDILIDGKNGFQTSAEVHAKWPRRVFPILLCSRIYRARHFREEALRSGAQDYILLPTKPETFLRRVNNALSAYVPAMDEGHDAAA